MNKDQFAGKWHEMKGKVREKWGKLTEDDVAKIGGRYEYLAGKLQEKYGWKKEQAEREINSWCSSCSSCDSCDKHKGHQGGEHNYGYDKDKKRKAG